MAELGKIGWLFDGGGFACARGAGMAEACWEAGIRPDYIQAVSGGIFNAAKIAESMDIAALKQIWLEVEKRGPRTVFNVWRGFLRLTQRKNAIFNSQGVENLFKHVDWRKLRRSPIQLEIAVTNESRGYRTDFFFPLKLDLERCKKLLYATTALMGFLPPVRIGDEVYSDGFFISLEQALAAGCDTVFIFVNVPSSPRVSDPENLNWYQRLRQCLRVVTHYAVNQEIETLLKERGDLYLYPHPYLPPPFAQLQDKYSQRKRKRRQIVYINPVNPIPTLELISFQKGDIGRAIKDAYQLTKKIISPLAQ